MSITVFGQTLASLFVLMCGCTVPHQNNQALVDVSKFQQNDSLASVGSVAPSVTSKPEDSLKQSSLKDIEVMMHVGSNSTLEDMSLK